MRCKSYCGAKQTEGREGVGERERESEGGGERGREIATKSPKTSSETILVLISFFSKMMPPPTSLSLSLLLPLHTRTLSSLSHFLNSPPPLVQFFNLHCANDFSSLLKNVKFQ